MSWKLEGKGMPFRLSVVLMLAWCARCAAADVQDPPYVLDPGSTITPVAGSTVIGPTESLAGSFTWHPSPSLPNAEVFNATALVFQSQSFTLVLDTTPANNYASDAFSDGRTFFDEIVDATGLASSLLKISSSGRYVGDYHLPTRVFYSDSYLVPPEGGFTQARVSMSATLIPEPSTAVLAGCAAITAMMRRRSARG